MMEGVGGTWKVYGKSMTEWLSSVPLYVGLSL